MAPPVDGWNHVSDDLHGVLRAREPRNPGKEAKEGPESPRPPFFVSLTAPAPASLTKRCKKTQGEANKQAAEHKVESTAQRKDGEAAVHDDQRLWFMVHASCFIWELTCLAASCPGLQVLCIGSWLATLGTSGTALLLRLLHRLRRWRRPLRKKGKAEFLSP